MSDKKKSLEVLNTELLSTKETLASKVEEFETFHKDNALKRKTDHSAHADEKIAKAWSKKKKELVELRAKRDALLEEIKEGTPKKEKSSNFAKKYTYPEDIQNDPEKKKKYRAEQRRLAKGGKKKEETSEKPAKVKAPEKTESKKKEVAAPAPVVKKKKKED